MRKVMGVVVGLVLASAVAVFAECGSCGTNSPAAGKDKKAECKAAKAECKAKVVYVCSECKIGSKKAGKCTKCGKDLVAMHVLSCADGMVTLCACGAGCKCTMAADGAKCSCGKDVVKIAAKDIAGCGACKKKAAPAPVAVPPAK